MEEIVTMMTPRRYRQLNPAPVRRSDAVTEFEQLQEQMGQIINSFFRDPFLGSGQQPSVWVPSADIEETDDAYVVDVELPGVRKEDVNIELRDNELRITGEIKQKERTGVLRRQTRRVGQFEYVAMLPGEVQPEKVDASLHDGVLTVRLGKVAPVQHRQTEVHDGQVMEGQATDQPATKGASAQPANQ